MLARVETRASASRTTVYCSRHDAARVLVQFSRYIYCTSCTTENSPCSTRSFYSYSLMICMHAPLTTPRILQLVPSPPCVGASEEVREEKRKRIRSGARSHSPAHRSTPIRVGAFFFFFFFSLSLSLSLSFSLPFRPLLCCEVCIWVGIWEEIRRCEGWNRISLGLEVTKDSLRLVEIDEVD